MRLLINGLHAKTGGGVTYLRNLLPHLANDPELECVLLQHRSQGHLYDAAARGMETRTVDFRPGFYRLLAWEQFVLPRLARDLGAEVTFSPANFGPLWAPRPVILLRNALAVAETDRRPGKQVYWWALGLMTRWSLARAPLALAVSEYARRALGAGAMAKVRVVHHGVDPRFAAGEGAREGFLLAVGDIYVQKNLLGLIEALAIVRRAVPGAHLRIAGRPVDADYLARVERRIAELGLAGAVEFLGHVEPDGLADLYRRCRLFVFPSLAETFGNPLVEAMACGAPVVCSNATAMPEVAGEAALYFDPRDPADMARTIVRVLGDPALAGELAGLSQIRATHFSWAETARRTADALKEAARLTER